MCRWIAYTGKPIAIDEYLFEQKYSLIEQSLHARKAKAVVNGDGFGLGWYGGREAPGLFRDILPAWSDENLRSLAQQIESGLFMAHVRAATDTATARSNCHPFVYEHQMFMHNGQIGGYCDVRRQLESSLNDDLYKFRVGSTDSELIFLLLVQYGIEADFSVACKKLIERVEAAMKQQKINEPFRFTAAFTDSKKLYAIRYSSDDQPPTLFYRQLKNGVLLVSEPLDEESSRWDSLTGNHWLEVSGPTRIECGPL